MAAGGSGAGSDVGMVRLPAGTGTGNGCVKFADGSTFTGEWVNGVVQGHGHFACGDKEYTGEFEHGRMHGQGVHRWKTGGGVLEYDGAWQQVNTRMQALLERLECEIEGYARGVVSG